jgi:hypothetical protein
MSTADNAVQAYILIIEDIEGDYQGVFKFVRNATAGMRPQPIITRLTARVQIEAKLAELTQYERTKILIIFDRLIDRDTDAYVKDVLDDYIITLWNQDHRTREGRVRVIVYTQMLEDLEGLKQHTHNRYVHKLQRGADEPLSQLKKAIEYCLSH